MTGVGIWAFQGIYRRCLGSCPQINHQLDLRGQAFPAFYRFIHLWNDIGPWQRTRGILCSQLRSLDLIRFMMLSMISTQQSKFPRCLYQRKGVNCLLRPARPALARLLIHPQLVYIGLPAHILLLHGFIILVSQSSICFHGFFY